MTYSKQILLKHIGKVYDTAKNSKLNESVFIKLKKDLQPLSTYFNSTVEQAFFIAIIIIKNSRESVLTINDLSDFFDCNPAKVLQYCADFDTLYENNIFLKPVTIRKSSHTLFNYLFSINPRVLQAIFSDSPLPQLISDKPRTVLDVFEELYYFGRKRFDNIISSSFMMLEVQETLKVNESFPIIKRISNLGLKAEETYLLVYVIRYAICGFTSVALQNAAAGIFDDKNAAFFFIQDIMAGKNPLIERKLLETEPADFFDDICIKLSDNTNKMLKEEGIVLFSNAKNNKNIIAPDSIKSKLLIYNKSEVQQISMLQEILEDKKMMQVQQQLSDRALPIGITAILYGMAGTGKTESVYQIAKMTNREILKVDISQTKSKWFGESEKIIKRVFSDYKSMAEESPIKPILLFNEADAIFSTRKDVGVSHVAQTENAIQNIILEELETFDGILIATTNLIQNLDSAFERRFLFKIQFNKPGLDEKAQIWKIKIPNLDENSCMQLANQFDFAGAQIDNIVRKAEIQQIVYNQNPTFDELIKFCHEENLVKNNRKKIGFEI